LRLSPQSLDLGQFIGDLKERMAEVSGMERCEVQVAEDLPLVSADPDRLERILANLLGNSLKYSTPGTPIRLTVARGHEEAVVSVTDEGPGIAADDLPHLFERYFRASGDAEHHEGLGLGLYITRGLVEAQGGRIWAASEAGKGSTFAFTVPFARDSDEPR
jgi:signal transduction histidine kinase